MNCVKNQHLFNVQSVESLIIGEFYFLKRIYIKSAVFALNHVRTYKQQQLLTHFSTSFGRTFTICPNPHNWYVNHHFCSFENRVKANSLCDFFVYLNHVSFYDFPFFFLSLDTELINFDHLPEFEFS